jgi:prepilin-type N-terminal cleavage/methylation domain-containing protein
MYTAHQTFWTRKRRAIQRGMTLLELVIACAILMILASAAIPIARFTVKRQKEAELRRDLREMRDAIDRYKDAADKGRVRVEVGTEGYPPDLGTLVTGVDVVSQTTLGATVAAGAAPGTGIGGAAAALLGAGAAGAAGFGSSGFGSTGFGSTGAGASGFGTGLSATNPASTFNTYGAASGSGSTPLSQHIRFLRKIPTDPMTGKAEWGVRSVQDDSDSKSWGGNDVFDVYSLSQGSAIDNTRYGDW